MIHPSAMYNPIKNQENLYIYIYIYIETTIHFY